MIKRITQKFKSGDFILSKIIVTDHKGIGVAHNCKEYIALWDTGANKSLISKSVVVDLNLKSSRECVNKTPNAISKGNIYNVSFIFQKEEINILEFDVLSGIETNMPWDVIIGMDIISLGSFSLIHKRDNLIEFIFEVDY